MSNILVDAYLRLRRMILSEEGQDLIEYALLVALIVFAATAGMGYLASGVNAAFNHVGTTISSAVA